MLFFLKSCLEDIFDGKCIETNDSQIVINCLVERRKIVDLGIDGLENNEEK